MASKYHSLKLFRLLIGDVSQVKFADMIGFDAAHVSRIEAGYRTNSLRMREAIKALLHPWASDADVDAMLEGEMAVEDVHRLANAYLLNKGIGPGGSKHGNQGTDAVGSPPVCAPAQPAGDRAAVQDDAGAGQQSGARASA